MTTERSNLVNIATGICVIAIGILLLLQQMGLYDLAKIIRLWPLALILMGGAIAWQGLRGGPVPGASIGGVFWLIVLGLLFSHTLERRHSATFPDGNGHINVYSVMNGDRRPALTGEFKGGHITTVMGGANLDLRQAALGRGETAVIDIFTVMGGGSIRVPSDWQVDLEAAVIAGGVKDERRRPTPEKIPAGEGTSAQTGTPKPVIPAETGPAPRLVLRGFVLFGGVTVKS